MRSQKLREVKCNFRSHSASKWMNQDLHPCHADWATHAFPPHHAAGLEAVPSMVGNPHFIPVSPIPL